MTVTMKQVIAVFNLCEPDYEKAASILGTEALPHLAELVRGTDSVLAARAVGFAGFFDGPEATEILTAGARRPETIVRVAAAASLERLAEFPDDLALSLLSDEYPGTRKWALKSVLASRRVGLAKRVESIAESDPEPGLQDLAHSVAQALYKSEQG